MAQEIQQRKQSPVVYSSAREQGYTHLQACLLAATLGTAEQKAQLNTLMEEMVFLKKHFNRERWGEDEAATARRAARHIEMDAAARLLQLLG